jgi:hypothetical protein
MYCLEYTNTTTNFFLNCGAGIGWGGVAGALGRLNIESDNFIAGLWHKMFSILF